MYSYSSYFYIENSRNKTKDETSCYQWMDIMTVAIFVFFCPLLFLNMFGVKLDLPMWNWFAHQLSQTYDLKQISEFGLGNKLLKE